MEAHSETTRPHVPFASAATALAVALLLSSFWAISTAPVGRLTFGRVLVVIATGALVFDVLRNRRLLRRPTGVATIVGAALFALVAWVIVNAFVWGRFSGGAVGGFVDIAAVTLLATAVSTIAPASRFRLLAAAAGGVILGALVAVVGIDPSWTSAAPDPDPGRLSGMYANSNFLGYAAAFALPLLIAPLVRGRGRLRWVALPAAVFVLVIIALTLSRGGVVAAFAGGLAAAALLAGTRRRRAAIVAGGTVAFIGVGALAYPYLSERRIEADFSTEIAALASRDLSGWDGTTQGFIPGTYSKLVNEENGSALRVQTSAPGEGVSFPWGRAETGREYVLRLQSRAASGRVVLHAGLEDNLRGNNPATATKTVTSAWTDLEVSWRPNAGSPDARLYVWQERGGDFLVRRVSISMRDPATGVPWTTGISVRLRGSEADLRYGQFLERAETGSLRVRLAGARLAAEALMSEPLRGVGWEMFPEYADAHDDYGAIATHNEYLRFAAELGVPGIALLVLIMSGVIRGLARLPAGPLRAAAAGMLVAGAVGLAFVNGLAVPSASAPFCMAIGVACAWRGSSIEVVAPPQQGPSHTAESRSLERLRGRPPLRTAVRNPN